MRAIKFRAWDNENNQMLDVQELNFEDCFYGGEMQIKTTMYNDYFDYREMPLMQFTGLHDENGKEIYEGDIVELSEEGRKLYGTSNELAKKYQLVGFKDGAFMTCRNKYLIDEFDTYLWIMKNFATVVGNIYENKELLNETNRE